MREFISSLTDADLNRTAHYRTTEGLPKENVLWHLMAHVVNRVRARRPNYDNFRAGTLDAPNTPAEGVFIARHEGRMVGLTTLELLPNGIGITGTTGVLAAHRGRGVAAMIKLASLRYLKEQGYREARTHNDTANPPILALNEKLGYRRLPGWLAWEKTL